MSAEKVKGSDKLLRLEIDLKEEKRQLVAGIANNYSPEEMEGKTIIVLYNLEPKKLMGIESQGMLLAASGREGPVILSPDKEVDPGTSIT